ADIGWDHPDNNITAIGTEPLRWESTAFSVDYQGAWVRYYFDDPQGLRTAWGDPSYSACQQWLSLAGWWYPSPWGNSSQQGYVTAVQGLAIDRGWTQPAFPPPIPTQTVELGVGCGCGAASGGLPVATLLLALLFVSPRRSQR